MNSVSFSPDGTKVASGSDDYTVKLWDDEWGVSAERRGILYVNSVSFSPDSSKIASGSDDETVKLRDGRVGSVCRRWRGILIMCKVCRFLQIGRRLRRGLGTDGEAKGCDVGRVCRRWRHSDYVNSVSFSPDGTKVASGSGHDGEAVGCDEGSVCRRWRGILHVCSVCRFLQMGRRLRRGLTQYGAVD